MKCPFPGLPTKDDLNVRSAIIALRNPASRFEGAFIFSYEYRVARWATSDTGNWSWNISLASARFSSFLSTSSINLTFQPPLNKHASGQNRLAKLLGCQQLGNCRYSLRASLISRGRLAIA
jgi:hypothetical protein